MNAWLGRLLGVENLEAIHDVQLKFAAPWAQDRPALVLFGCILLAALAVVFYVRFQSLTAWGRRAVLIALRAILLAGLLVVLAEPVISMTMTHHPKSLLLMLFDCTDSMNMRDKLSPEARQAYQALLGKGFARPRAGREDPSRLQLARSVLVHRDSALLKRLAEEYRLQCYALDRPDQVREINLTRPDSSDLDGEYILRQLQGAGKVTALGEGLNDLNRRHPTHVLAGTVIVSDFAQNAGTPPLAAAERFKVPLHTVGVGPREVIDLSVDLQAPLLLKKSERTDVTVLLRQAGLSARHATVELYTRRLGTRGGRSAISRPERAAEARTVKLDAAQVTVHIPFTPEEVGRFDLLAKVQPYDDEVLEENNEAHREITVRDECLKILFVEYEPTWEWRFVKEVFHRDPLIGWEGFRTFLRSADFKVRQTNDLFVETLIRPRSEFFSYDVILVSDVPGEVLSEQFQDMLREYVGKFGGGLVFLAGPRFGPSELRGTVLADMLPVVIDPGSRIRDGDFELRLTPAARQYDFLSLGESEQESLMAWDNLGSLPWYQPVARKHPLGTVLAQHPTDRCSDEKTPQPLIAVRRFGKGEVIYFGFNETWRLRRKYGERYYRQLWGQIIYRLGLGRALGSQKRFLAQTDRRTYQAGDKVRVIVEAYNSDYEPLQVEKLSGRLLVEKREGGEAPEPVQLSIPLARDKVIFETTLPVFTSGSHRLLIRDPVTTDEVEVSFKVAPVTAERRSAVRDYALQNALAGQTGGKSYELTEMHRIPDNIVAPQLVEKTERRFELWNTWLVLLLGLGLMLTEWLLRKLQNLR
jgi:hypothetical protein